MWTKSEIQAWIEKYYTLENKPEMLYNLDSGYKMQFRDGQTYEYRWLKPAYTRQSNITDIHEVYINGELVQRFCRNYYGEKVPVSF